LKFEIRKSFEKDCKKIPPTIKSDLAELFRLLQGADSLAQISNCKKMKGSENAYRIRLGNYRVGFYIIDDQIEFSRMLHRKDMYKYFPK
jgi:mRNA interferase RelE/StbE